MQKRSLVVSLMVVLILGFAILAFAQRAARSSSVELGYYDRSTGVFTPLPEQAAPEAELPPVAPTTGTLVFKFTITAKSGVPKNGVIACSANAFVTESSGLNITEKASAIATLVSGNTYACTATVDYSWPLSTPSTDKISFADGMKVSTVYGYQVTATNGTGTLVAQVSSRESDPIILPNISVPPNGTTTTENISITL